MVVTVQMLTCFVKILIKINCISKTIFSLNLYSTVSFTPDPSPLTTLSGTSVAISHNKESILTYNHRSLSLMHFRCAKCLIHFFFEVVPISSIHPLILSSLPSWPSTHCSLHCTHCSLFGTLQPSCYFSAMLRCITHGWHIPCNYSAIVPRYRVTGNYPAIDLFLQHGQRWGHLPYCTQLCAISNSNECNHQEFRQKSLPHSGWYSYYRSTDPSGCLRLFC